MFYYTEITLTNSKIKNSISCKLGQILFFFKHEQENPENFTKELYLDNLLGKLVEILNS